MVSVRCSIRADGKARDLGVRSVGVLDPIGDFAINQPAEWQRVRFVGRERCRCDDYFDRRSNRTAAEYHQQPGRALPAPGCAAGRLSAGSDGQRLCALLGGSDVKLVVKTPSTIINVKFQVAGVAELITVEGQAPLITRTDASLGNTFEENQIAELPIADRNVAYLLSLQPGVVWSWGWHEANQATDTRSGAVNGARSDQSNVTLDGIGVNDQNNGYAFTSVLNTPPDSVEEFRVTTANSNADTGYSSGGQVALVTKSGTNNFFTALFTSTTATLFLAPMIRS